MQAAKARHSRIFNTKFLVRELEKIVFNTFGMKQEKN